MEDQKSKLTAAQFEALFRQLEGRFEKHGERHEGISWAQVHAKLKESNEKKLMSLYEMEQSGGQPDVVGYDAGSDEYIFYDCSPESPEGRRALCYDRKALDSRKKNKPENSVMDVAASMGIEVLTEDQYKGLQTMGEFDTKTSSWIVTPDAIRKRGGALFGDRRYDHVFIYHNGADSYYGARGFRGSLRV